ncbi:hypothetical protein P171DRAFT_211894 [Karstenula rhodostoma CBS 690.94]|uniref:RING-type domain-containing protein n=1 Tax=Karstenula rhodostoma CBS 690.94 TaxID=1392251 RepID=A0A9P4UE01_9PLEO|nr:hypothetical protein P171DRAFT_211894 [Karstenula rhodostoma CBS 690.94]
MNPDPDFDIINISRLHLIPRYGADFEFERVAGLPKDAECPICLRAYGTLDPDDTAPPCTAIRVFHCGHVLGKHCLMLHRSKTGDTHCPYCRQYVFRVDPRSPPARFTLSQKFFQRVSEAWWYQLPERILMYNIDWFFDSEHAPYKTIRNLLQQGAYFTTGQSSYFIVLHLALTLYVLAVLYLTVAYPIIFASSAGINLASFLLGSCRLGWNIFAASGPIFKLRKILSYAFFLVEILHGATSISVIRREIKRVNMQWT